MRRSLTITAENDKKILLSKGIFLTGDTPFDIDYTTMVNIFIDLGHKAFNAMKMDSPQITIDKSEIINIFSKYFSSPELKEEALVDQFTELFNKKIFEQWQKTATQSNSQKPMLQSNTQGSNSPNTNKFPEYVS